MILLNPSTLTIGEGLPYPMGATWDGQGVNFANVQQPWPPAVGQHQFRYGADGFTLNDFVTYNEKRNKANGEDNRDASTAALRSPAFAGWAKTRRFFSSSTPTTEDISFVIPATTGGHSWSLLIDTNQATNIAEERVPSGAGRTVAARSFVLLALEPDTEGRAGYGSATK